MGGILTRIIVTGNVVALALVVLPLAGQPAPPEPPAPPQVFALSGGHASQSYLGVGVVEIDSGRARALNLKEERGVEVTRIEDESPASKAGLKTGDVVLEYNGQSIEGYEQFARMVRETPAGRNVKLLISRGGSTQVLQTVIGSRKAHVESEDLGYFPKLAMPGMLPLPDFPGPDAWNTLVPGRGGVLGVEVEALSSQLGEYFGVKEGVLVRSVAKDSAAARAGIKAGDVLLKIDENRVTTPAEVSTWLRSARAKNTVSIALMRDHRELVIQVALGGGRSEDGGAGKTRAVVRGRAVKM